MNGKGISLVVPVYNEAEIIEESIHIFIKTLQRITRDFEIIVVDDGSVDGTPKILEKLSGQNEKIKVFYNEKNMGSGASLWRGFKEATGAYLISNFADRPFDLHELPALIDIFNSGNIDFVIGVRRD
jgi:glycosyltransferase involved in cell wall biosynthesis